MGNEPNNSVTQICTEGYAIIEVKTKAKLQPIQEALNKLKCLHAPGLSDVQVTMEEERGRGR